MFNFKNLQIESIGPVIILGLMLLVVVGVVHVVFEVILQIGLGAVFGDITTADTLLFLIFLTQVAHYLRISNDMKSTKTTAKKK